MYETFHLQIDYFNNKIICDLIDQQHKGIIAILDEACLNVGKVTDKVRAKANFFLSVSPFFSFHLLENSAIDKNYHI